MRLFDGFGVSVGINVVSAEPSLFGPFLGWVSETVHDEPRCTVAGSGAARLGRGIPYPGHPWSGLVQQGSHTPGAGLRPGAADL